MKKDKFITVMAVLDEDTQCLLQGIQEDLERQYGVDTKTKDIPYHITLGSYAVEETDEIVARISRIAEMTKPFPVRLGGLNHFGNQVRYIEPEVNGELIDLHKHFDSDYANGFHNWVPHITVYRHNAPTEIECSRELLSKLENLANATIVGIELGEFFPPRKIVRVLFDPCGENR